MHTFRIGDILKDRILVSRESARSLEGLLAAILENPPPSTNASNPASLTVDFAGVAGVAPSFLDEFIAICESLISHAHNGRKWCLIVVNPPTRLSRKFEAVARGHGMTAQAMPDGSWLLTAPGSP